MTTPSKAELWCNGQEPVLRVLLNGVMTDIGEPPGAKFRWTGEGDAKRLGEYREPGKKGNVRAKPYNRSRVRNDAGLSQSVNKIDGKKPRSGEGVVLSKFINKIMGQKSRGGIDVKKKVYGIDAWKMFTSLKELGVPRPDTLKISALYLGAKHGLLGTDAFRVMILTL